jgi:hypothetical protein
VITDNNPGNTARIDAFGNAGDTAVSGRVSVAWTMLIDSGFTSRTGNLQISTYDETAPRSAAWVVDSGRFDWAASPRFKADFVDPG